MEKHGWFLEARSSGEIFDPSHAQKDKIGKALLGLAAKCRVWHVFFSLC